MISRSFLWKRSKYLPTEQHWTYTSIFKIWCLWGLGKLWVNNTIFQKFFFWQLSPEHVLRHPYLYTNNCFYHRSKETFSLPLRGNHLCLKQLIFFYLLTGSQNYFPKCVIQISPLFKQACMERDLQSSFGNFFQFQQRRFSAA